MIRVLRQPSLGASFRQASTGAAPQLNMLNKDEYEEYSAIRDPTAQDSH
jgi:hypothetical protein